MSKTSELMRAQLTELSAQREAIVAKSAPLRAQRDKIKNEAFAAIAPIEDEIKAIEAGLAEIDMDLSRLSRALGGRSMNQVA